ncbi:GNAT family N-acetyltransferase [Paenibacillus senegalimassiliensis]|uniref:GNAT family N-acetyltransferase n=1 Tax=Paenibacillus senegalimassiliensis TaxID=1737426 RepID=UPI00073F980E|nr:GNAT family N-acetyltransferase [Paenibacillus senegalimassiliensis]
MIVKLPLEDADIVEQLWSMQHQAYRLEAEAVGLTEYPPLTDTFDSIRSSGDVFYGDLEQDGELQGAIGVRSEIPGELLITRLMVQPDHLRQGIGRSLLRHVLTVNEDIRVFKVTASSLNEPATRLYRDFGFEPIQTFNSAAGVELTLFRLNG